MSDKKEKPKDSAPAPDAAAPAKKGLPIKTIAIVGVLMAAEAGAVVMVLGMFGGPKHSDAATPKELVHDDSEELQEIEIVSDKYQNLTTGRVWVWDVSVFVQVKNKNAERIEKVLEQRKAEISEGLGQIVSRAQHAQLKEPDRQSINRQFAAFLEKTAGGDADGKSLIERVLIPKCRGYPADF